MGVIILKNTATTLSIGEVTAGHMYSNMQGTKKMTTAVMWETQVERALRLASKLWVLRV